MKKRPVLASFIFLITELILYNVILTSGGELLKWTSYIAIVLCFLHSLLYCKNDPFICCGLGCTVCADFFLVICDPIQRLWGMVFFLAAQTLYAIKLHAVKPLGYLLWVRLLLILLSQVIIFIVLKDKADGLAIISMYYYANLIMNIIAGFSSFTENRMFTAGLALFALCDTVIGLQVASGAYLPINGDSLLHRIIFMNFNLSWLFYLPAQVLISLSGIRRKTYD